MTRSELIEKVKLLPQSPGVYMMLDANEKIIYVGKSAPLRYFRYGNSACQKQTLCKFDFLHSDIFARGYVIKLFEQIPESAFSELTAYNRGFKTVNACKITVYKRLRRAYSSIAFGIRFSPCFFKNIAKGIKTFFICSPFYFKTKYILFYHIYKIKSTLF